MIEGLLACELLIAAGFILIGELHYRRTMAIGCGHQFYKAGFISLTVFATNFVVWWAG